MTTERVGEIVRGLLRERNQPVEAVKVLPPGQHNLLVAVRFGAQIETQCLVDPDWESEEELVERLGKWLNIEIAATRSQTRPEAAW